MNINDDIVIVDIEDKSHLLTHYDGIAELFLESFGRKLDIELWKWAYIDNPFGDPIVSIAFHNNKIIGHYAVVPMNLENSQKLVKGFLSMTTMVAVSFRKHRLFQILAERVYEKIKNLNESAVVFGFPNENSTPGFIRRLGWSISEEYKVVTLKTSLIDTAIIQLEKYINSDSLTLNLEKNEICKWRTNKPNQTWSYKNGIGLKNIEKSFDVMHLNKPDALSLAKKLEYINIILPISDNLMVELGYELAFSYRFGYRTFNMDSSPKIFVQMSMSDIF